MATPVNAAHWRRKRAKAKLARASALETGAASRWLHATLLHVTNNASLEANSASTIGALYENDRLRD
jgi:hypothetical protein